MILPQGGSGVAPQHGTGGKLLLGGAFGLESRLAYGGSWAAAESASGSGGYRDLVLGASVFRAGRSQKGRNAPGAAFHLRQSCLRTTGAGLPLGSE